MAKSTPVLRWRERADQWLTFPLGRFLDYGCGRGQLLEAVGARCTEAHGVDVDAAALAEAATRIPHARLQAIGTDGRTPFPDGFFDTIAIVEVIEHVPDERATLAELARLLKPGGRLLLTTPHRGLLTFLDVGNVKFVLPRLHRFIHQRLLRQSDHYEDRFARPEETGLIGDISFSTNRRPWHRHYRPKDIASYGPPSLRLERWKVYFPGMRAFMVAHQLLFVFSLGKLSVQPWPLPGLERQLSRVESPWGDQLVMLFRKESAHQQRR